VRDLIVMIHNGAPSDTKAASNVRGSVGPLGYRLEELSVSDSLAGPKLATLLRERRDEIFLFFSSNFWVQNIRQNDRLLHQFTGIPLAIFMHDHPVYFLAHISAAFDGTIMFAVDGAAPDFIAKYYPARVLTIAHVGGITHVDDGQPSYEQFLGRRNELLCPLNLVVGGRTMDDAWHEIKQLPHLRRRRAVRVIEAVLIDCKTPLHVVSERLAAEGDPELAIDDLRPVLEFVKLWRRNTLVRALIDLPILIGSEYVPADLEFRYPGKFMSLTAERTLELYREFRFTVSLSPLMSCSLHDRVSSALAHNSVCITDPNAHLLSYFEDERDLIYYDFALPDMAARIGHYLENPAGAFALTVSAAGRRERILSTSSYRKLIATVEAIWSEKKPAAAPLRPRLA
jgi:hypothetical protein